MAKDGEKLSEDFQHEKSEWLEKYDAILNEMNALVEVKAFKFGYNLAFKMMIEIK